MAKQLKNLCLAVLVGMFVNTAVFADAFEGLSMMRMGAWDVDFSGNVNGFATIISCDAPSGGGQVAHGLACGSDGVDDDDTNNVQTGLLPSWFNFSAATLTDSGIKTGVHLSFQPGIDTASPFGGPLDAALGLNASNFRQVFLTWGSDSMGTFKIGRDLGLFGSDAILSDMTLLGVGTVSDLTQRGGNTTLGRIGIGYLYADWKSQVQYKSPNLNGFSFTAALVDPWGADSLANGTGACGPEKEFVLDPETGKIEGGNKCSYSATHGNGQEGDTYGFEAKVNYNTELEGSSLALWASYIRQEVDFGDAEVEDPRDPNKTIRLRSPDADGFDVGAKLAFGGFDVVGYYYDGEGIGSTGFLLDGIDAVGEERDSNGYYFQARYRMPTTGTLFGFSYGESTLDESGYDEWMRTKLDSNMMRVNPGYSLLDSNESWIVGVYHPIGEALNLVAEYTSTEAESHDGNEAEEDVFALGAIMFF